MPIYLHVHRERRRWDSVPQYVPSPRLEDFDLARLVHADKEKNPKTTETGPAPQMHAAISRLARKESHAKLQQQQQRLLPSGRPHQSRLDNKKTLGTSVVETAR